jgi:GNAT superfamily N-acetyltransferase
MSTLIIKEIQAKDCFALRQKVLRKDLDLLDCKFEQDDLETCFHIGAILDEEVVGIASFFEEHDKNFEGRSCYRLRGMATDTNHHGKGIGKAVLLEAFNHLRKRNVEILWCNAREIAFPFYEKLGFKYYSEMFDIPKVGPHKKMYFNL